MLLSTSLELCVEYFSSILDNNSYFDYMEASFMSFNRLFLWIPALFVAMLVISAARLQAQAANQIAFVSDRDGNKEIYVMNADGSNQRRLTDNPANDDNP